MERWEGEQTNFGFVLSLAECPSSSFSLSVFFVFFSCLIACLHDDDRNRCTTDHSKYMLR